MNSSRPKTDWMLVAVTAGAVAALTLLTLVSAWIANPNSHISARCSGGRYGSCYYWFR